MKKSAMVTLVLSGALLGGCDNRAAYRYSTYPGYPTGTNVTNNTYVPGLGYYHAPYHNWFQFPYNFFRPGYGYYHGGFYSPAPFVSDILASAPPAPSAYRFVSGSGGGGGGSFTHVGSSSPGFFGGSSISRGGFGSIGHGSIGS